MSGWLRNRLDSLFGFDFFISYAHADGTTYPRRLQQRLRDSFGMRTFLDTSPEGFTAGEELKAATRRRIRMSRYLVLVARPAAMRSPWVKAEIEACLAAGRSPVVIDVNGTLQVTPENNPIKRLLRDRISVAEALPKDDGEPSAETLESLRRAFKVTRIETLRLRVVSAAALFFAGLAILSGILYFEADRARRAAERQQRLVRAGLLASQARENAADLPQRALLLAVEAVQLARQDGEADPAANRPAEALQETLLTTRGSRVLPGHKAPVWVATFSPDSRWIATGDERGSLRLWSARESGRAVRTFSAHRGEIVSAAFSPDSRWLATGGADRSVKLWSVSGSTVELLHSLSGPGGVVFTLSFSPDGKLLAAGDEGGLAILWDLQKTSPSRTIVHSNRGPLYKVEISPDGLWLATGGKGALVHLWPIKNREAQRRSLVAAEDEVNDLAFSPDGKWLATAGRDGNLRLWPLQNTAGGRGKTLRKYFSGVDDLVFSPDSRWLAASGTTTVDLWSLSSSVSLVRTLAGSVTGYERLAFSPDSRWLAGGGSHNVIQIWAIRQDSQPPLILRGHENEVLALEFSPDRSWIVTGGADRSARLWSWSGELEVPRSIRIPITTLSLAKAFSPDGKWAAAEVEDGLLLLRSLTEGEPRVRRLTGVSRGVRKIMFSPDAGWLAAITYRGDMRLWSLLEGSSSPAPFGAMEKVSVAAFSSDSRFLATGTEDGSICIHDLARRVRCGYFVRGDGNGVFHMAFDASSGWLAADGKDGSIRMLRFQSGLHEAESLRGHPSEVDVLSFSPDGAWLVSIGRDGDVRIWSKADRWSPKPLRRFKVPRDITPPEAAFSPDGSWLALAGSGEIVRLLSIEDTWSKIRTLRGHHGDILSLAFSPDNRWLATGGWDTTARLWALGQGDLDSRVLRGADLPLHGLTFDSDGRHLSAAIGPNEILTWPLTLDELIGRACLSAGRNLTSQEWQTFLPALPFKKTCKEF